MNNNGKKQSAAATANSVPQITVPYTFIPLSSWVFHPSWAEDTSHDVPFQDGLSGRINFEITNNSPICVGHASVTGEKGAKHLIWEKDAAGHLVIPGSSIKGMLRTALEIVSFGRLQFFHDRKHAFRLEIGEVKGESSNYDLLPVFIRPKASSEGLWEYFRTSTRIGDKPSCASVNEADLMGILGSNVSKASASEKFKLLYTKYCPAFNENSPVPLPMPLLYAELKQESGYSAQQMKKPESERVATTWMEVKSVSLKPDEKHRYPGMFMFMNENISNKGSGKANKFTDYFMYVNDEEQLKNQQNWQPLENTELIRDLNDSLPPIKADSDGGKEDNLYNFYHSHMHQNYGFPIWYLKDQRGNSDALGFCQIMRKVHSKSIGDMIKDSSRDLAPEAPDLPDLMFGHISGNDESNAAGSRIGFSDVRSVGIPKIETRQYVLGEPKPTFYPEYLGMFDFKKPYEENSIIAGRKMYKIRQNFELADPKFPNDNEKVRTAIDFAQKDSTFRGTVVFHNLKPEELGALLWVMTFGEGEASASGKHFHSLGHARPMGAGAVRFRIRPDDIVLPPYLQDGGKVEALGCSPDEIMPVCLRKFEELMNFNYPFAKPEEYTIQNGKWLKSRIMTTFLRNATEDTATLKEKVYNEFPDEFTSIKRDYTNKSTASQNPGHHDDGKKTGNAAASFSAEKENAKNIETVMAERQKIMEKEKQKEQAKIAEQKKAEEQKQAAASGYQTYLADGDMIRLHTFVLCHPDAQTQLEQDKTAGKLSKNWKCGNINQLLKDLCNDESITDSVSAAKAMAEILSSNESVKAEAKKVLKKLGGKKDLKNNLAKDLNSLL
ncbi:MAG: TIGR03986 family CRISPR-associated RAMP protein [Succinivibrionaceae bacterium]|nr:TIGR03986 family CRISPR-associated RAMP protein [Succinivibrionaceae bacterium]